MSLLTVAVDVNAVHFWLQVGETHTGPIRGGDWYLRMDLEGHVQVFERVQSATVNVVNQKRRLALDPAENVWTMWQGTTGVEVRKRAG